MAADTTARTRSACVRFVLDGAIVEARNVAPTTTVLEYLRDVLGRTGTKEGCAEGDCGACTVVVGELRPDHSVIDYRAINSCIRYLPTLDGQELVTVESLQDDDRTLHPVQQSMVDHHASQCGFCTPGFVMSLFALYLNNPAPRRPDVVDALAGNLCRCTGYRPIIDAGCELARYPQPQRWSQASSQSAERIAALRSLERTQSLAIEGFKAPRTIEELASTLAAEPHSLLLAGGTDIGLWTTKQLRDLPPLIYIGAIKELKQVRVTDTSLRIGAAVTLTDAWRVIVDHHPALSDLARRFASPPVNNSGTLCGNIANASPIGDSMPALLALGATIELRNGPQTRELSLDEFYLGYQRKDLQPGELVVSVSIPLARPTQRIAAYKVSKRFDQDISAVCGAFSLELRDQEAADIRIAFGGVAAIPTRAPRTEKALLGRPWNATSVAAAAAVLAAEFDPLTDMRASAAYRQRIATNLLWRFFNETTRAVPLDVRHTAVVS